MHRCKKKILALVLLAFMSAPIFISAYQLIKQQYIQHLAKQQLEHEALETIVVSACDLHWVKKNKEILLDGKLFDVKHIKEFGKNYIITGLFDDEETAIVKKIEASVRANNANTGSTTNTTLHFLLLTVFSNLSYTTIIYTPATISATQAGYYNKATCSRALSVNTPPPNKA
jgi:hypothetical protein